MDSIYGYQYFYIWLSILLYIVISTSIYGYQYFCINICVHTALGDVSQDKYNNQLCLTLYLLSLDTSLVLYSPYKMHVLRYKPRYVIISTSI